MVTVTSASPEVIQTLGPEPTDRRAHRRRPRYWRAVVLGLTGIYFLFPLYAALKFSLSTVSGAFSFIAYRSLPSQQGFSAAFGLSLRLALVTIVITLVLMVPTAVYVHLRLPQLRPAFDAITILPIVIPPVVLIVGVLQVAPSFLKGTPYLLALEYVVLAMPFAYRSLDAGLRAMDLKTLVEAGRSLGSRGFSTFLRVIIPNLRSAILSATVLTVALVLGEFTMASLDQYQTFQPWIVAFDQDNAQVSVAASVLSLLVTWGLLMLILSLDLRRTRRSVHLKEAS
jgi:putative spermidine/putrescine transport system permease protein